MSIQGINAWNSPKPWLKNNFRNRVVRETFDKVDGAMRVTGLIEQEPTEITEA